MNVIDFLGFIVVIAAMTFIVLRQAYERYRERRYPEAVARERAEQEQELKQFLRALNIETESEEEARAVIQAPPIPDRIVRDEFAYERPIESRRLTTAIEKRSYKTNLDDRYEVQRRSIETPTLRIPRMRDVYAMKGESSAAGRLIQKGHLKQAILLREILGPPRHEQI